jgi:hypothetical protein
MSTGAASNHKLIIPLKRPYPLLTVGAVGFLGSAVFFFARAQTNEQGLLINGIIRLGPDAADVFYVVLGLMGLGMGLVSMSALVFLLRRKHYHVVLREKGIELPGTLLRPADVVIPYETIVAIAAVPPEAPKLVRIQTTGRPMYIASQSLHAAWPASRVASTLVKRWRAAIVPSSS